MQIHIVSPWFQITTEESITSGPNPEHIKANENPNLLEEDQMLNVWESMTIVIHLFLEFYSNIF